MSTHHGAVFVFEGLGCQAFASVEAAALDLEAIDVENGEYDFFGEDGTVLRAWADGRSSGRVFLTPTDERRPEQLRRRLRAFLDAVPHGSLAADWDPDLADDPQALAAVMARPGPSIWRRMTPRWLGG